MMKVTINNGRLQVALSGWDWFFTLRRRVEVPVDRIRSVRLAPELKRPYGIKMPGSGIPGVIFAGTWRWKGRKEFWNVRRDKNKWVAIEVADNEYALIVLQVNDPNALISEIERVQQF